MISHLRKRFFPQSNCCAHRVRYSTYSDMEERNPNYKWNMGSIPRSNNTKPLVFMGHGASPGFIKGRALVYHDERDLRSLIRMDMVPKISRGTILVLPIADHTMNSVIADCDGIVCQVGGHVSHSGMVARRLGIPCVNDMEESNFCKLVETGDEIIVSGNAGTVTIVKPKK